MAQEHTDEERDAITRASNAALLRIMAKGRGSLAAARLKAEGFRKFKAEHDGDPASA